MPVNKLYDRDRMKAMLDIDAAMYLPKLDDILGSTKLEKGHLSMFCGFAMPRFSEMRGVHSTMAIHAAVACARRNETNTPVFHLGYEPMLYYPTDYDIEERLGLHQLGGIPSFPITPDFSIGDLIVDSIRNFEKPRQWFHIDSFIGDDDFAPSVCIYDEEKIKTYKIPSKDRLDMLCRLYKLIKGNK
jgi:hypothetical protein